MSKKVKKWKLSKKQKNWKNRKFQKKQILSKIGKNRKFQKSKFYRFFEIFVISHFSVFLKFHIFLIFLFFRHFAFFGVFCFFDISSFLNLSVLRNAKGVSKMKLAPWIGNEHCVPRAPLAMVSTRRRCTVAPSPRAPLAKLVGSSALDITSNQAHWGTGGRALEPTQLRCLAGLGPEPS